MWGLKELGICSFCGNKVYDTLSKPRGWKFVEGEPMHLECYLALKEEEKANKLLEAFV
jgi:hypothetical protein